MFRFNFAFSAEPYARLFKSGKQFSMTIGNRVPVPTISIPATALSLPPSTSSATLPSAAPSAASSASLCAALSIASSFVSSFMALPASPSAAQSSVSSFVSPFASSHVLFVLPQQLLSSDLPVSIVEERLTANLAEQYNRPHCKEQFIFELRYIMDKPNFADKFILHVVKKDKLRLLRDLNKHNCLPIIFNKINKRSTILLAKYLLKNLSWIDRKENLLQCFANYSKEFCDMVANKIMSGSQTIKEINEYLPNGFMHNLSEGVTEKILAYVFTNLNTMPKRNIAEALLTYSFNNSESSKYANKFIQHIIKNNDYELLKCLEQNHIQHLAYVTEEKLCRYVSANITKVYEVNKQLINYLVSINDEFKEKVIGYIQETKILTNCPEHLLSRLYDTSPNNKKMLEAKYYVKWNFLTMQDKTTIVSSWNPEYVKKLLQGMEKYKYPEVKQFEEIFDNRMKAEYFMHIPIQK